MSYGFYISRHLTQGTKNALCNQYKFYTLLQYGERAGISYDRPHHPRSYGISSSSKGHTDALSFDKYDKNDCKLIITAGVGGAEACDWCKMLSRMYKKFVSSYKMPEDKKFGPLPEVLKYVEVTASPGDLNGYKMVEVDIIGKYAYKLLKGEKGTHRLVRHTPFHAAKKRQTTFGGVQVIPILSSDDEDVKFYNKSKNLQEKDLIFESMRSEGKGGQNVNKVETAVRVTHKPTGLSVKVQQERTNTRNKQIALQKLAEKVELHYRNILQERLEEVKGTEVDASWARHIRSYVLNPEQRFKDHRTNYETAAVHDIMDGDLLPVILTYLEHLK
ncbi:peptide chain release factor 2, putative [Theileria equi strain WA]|uniref:Peptide chain release factor 2, putative n=1 Tax=Theileria equi strain WA TaxID=1537102 RepID=L0B1U8_THEEQ|nr:peptide chain release factor 2, putative [Theileria equi strain WA]AFZ81104.1 peptide chain release factor 2, putative [Theileria equi strain WA]|eukprot:XP_004830770.1 peptide chain release factor 2, putative [Theileria equi strain WA]